MSEQVAQHPSAPRVPGYVLTRPLGRGPQAEVWKALQERTGKWVAVKVFTDREAFDWEALRANTERLVRLDRHPNVVSLLDADLAAEPPFFAMDLMEDDSLARRLASGEPVSQEDAVSWFEDAARALAYIHGKGLIHGGLKAANILIDEQGRARISDLGQARKGSDGAQDAADVSDDIRSLAEALSSVAGAGADEDLRAILEKCRAREDGYDSVVSLLTDLEARRGRFPVSPLAESRVYRARRFLQRHTAAAVLAAACAGAVVWGVATVSARNAALTAELASSYSERARNALLQGQPAASAMLFAKSNLLRPTPSARRDALAVLAGLARPRASWNTGEAVGVLAASPDGRRVLAGGGDRPRIYDGATGAPIEKSDEKTYRVGLVGFPNSADFSADGKRAYAATGGYEVVLFDPEDGRVIESVGGTAAAISKSGGLFAVVREQKVPARPVIVLFDAATGKPTGVTVIHESNRGSNVAVALSPDGTRLASVGGGVLRLWDARTGRRLAGDVDFGGPGSSLYLGSTEHVAFDASGTRLLLRTFSEAFVFDSFTGRPVADALRHEGRVLSAAANRATVITGGEDGMVRFWTNGRLLGEVVPQSLRHAGAVNAVAIAPSGGIAASAGEDGTVRLWNIMKAEPYGPVLPHRAGVVSLAFSKDGQTLFTGDREGMVRSWDIPRPESAPPNFLGNQAVLSPDASTLVYFESEHGVTLRTVADGRLLATKMLGTGNISLDITRFSANGDRLILSRWGSDELSVWDARTGRMLGTHLRLPSEDDRNTAGEADISPDGTLVAMGGGHGTIMLYDAQSGSPKGPAAGLKGFPSGVSFSPDGRRLAAADFEETLVWEVPPGPKPVLTVPHGGSILAWSVDGRYLAAADSSLEKSLLVWDTRENRAAGPPMKFGSTIVFVKFSPDGRRLAVGSDDGTARLIDPSTGRPVGPPPAPGRQPARGGVLPGFFGIRRLRPGRHGQLLGRRDRSLDRPAPPARRAVREPRFHPGRPAARGHRGLEGRILGPAVAHGSGPSRRAPAARRRDDGAQPR